MERAVQDIHSREKHIPVDVGEHSEVWLLEDCVRNERKRVRLIYGQESDGGKRRDVPRAVSSKE